MMSKPVTITFYTQLEYFQPLGNSAPGTGKPISMWSSFMNIEPNANPQISVAAASSLTRNRQDPGPGTRESGKQFRLVAYKV